MPEYRSVSLRPQRLRAGLNSVAAKRGVQKEWYQVFRFADEQHAEIFMKEFGGERMHPSERGKGKRWSMWKKGTYKPKPRSPYDFS